MEKQTKIVEMFNDIAPTYDKANRVMSMGVDRSWRRNGSDKSFGFDGKKKIALIVDYACGLVDLMD